jgi:hypothetical protein
MGKGMCEGEKGAKAGRRGEGVREREINGPQELEEWGGNGPTCGRDERARKTLVHRPEQATDIHHHRS